MTDYQPDLIISQEIYDKIKYLCQKIPKEEWSGVLFYTVKGTIKNPKTFKIYIKDIFPMNKGSKAFTEYDFSDKALIDYRMDNLESHDWKIGHIHSHNTMRVFFSGTDMSELIDNSEFHNYYVSLIVNNFMETTAKVAFRGEPMSSTYLCKNEDGSDYQIKIKPKESETVLYHYDCNIIKPLEETLVPDSFQERVSTIIEKCDKIEIKKQRQIVVKNYVQPVQTGWEIEESKETVYQRFVLFLLRLGNSDLDKDTLEAVIEDLTNSDIDYNLFTASIIEQYHSLYDNFFNDHASNKTEEIYLKTLDEVIRIFEDTSYEEFEKIENGLKRYYYRLTTQKQMV